MDRDLQIRLAGFDWLSEQTDIHGDVLPRDLLQQGFEFEGRRVPLISPQGIFKPRIAELPLKITTAPHGPCDDNYVEATYLEYRYRGTDPDHRDNVGLRRLWELGHLDNSVEPHLMDDRYQSLFPEPEIEGARRRLDVLGYM
jgi:putative restriction endonuclease